MQGIRDEGNVDWRSIDVGAAVGIFEVPTDMPYYKAATTTDGGRSPRQSVCYLIRLIQLFCRLSFIMHVSIVDFNNKSILALISGVDTRYKPPITRTYRRKSKKKTA